MVPICSFTSPLIRFFSSSTFDLIQDIILKRHLNERKYDIIANVNKKIKGKKTGRNWKMKTEREKKSKTYRYTRENQLKIYNTKKHQLVYARCIEAASVWCHRKKSANKNWSITSYTQLERNMNKRAFKTCISIFLYYFLLATKKHQIENSGSS